MPRPIAIVTALLAIGSTVGVAAAPAEPEPATGWIRLTDRAWAFVAEDDISSNGALLIGDDAALVVDPGVSPEIFRRFLTGAAELTDRPLRYAVLTHWHPDHALGTVCSDPAGRPTSAADLTVLAHPKARRALAERAARVAPGFGIDGCTVRLPEPWAPSQPPDRSTLDLGGHAVEILHPGTAHTPGDLVVWSPTERVLITGDLFLHDSSPYMGDADTGNWIAALEKLLELEPLHVVPGHFAVGTAEDLARFRRYLQAVDGFAAARLPWGLSPEEVASQVPEDGLELYEGFAQYPQYAATVADNVRVAAEERARRPARRGELAGFRVRQVLDVGRNPHQIAFSEDGRTAYVAAAGSDRIVEVAIPDGDGPLSVTGAREIEGTPLGVVELPAGDPGGNPRGDLAVALFGGGRLVRLPAAGGPPAASLDTGRSPSLLVGPIPGLDGNPRYLVSAEGVDKLYVLDPQSFELAARYTVGDRPFPPGITSDGRKAFVPGYDDASVTAVDLWNGEALEQVRVGDRPSGGAVLPGDALYRDTTYAVAVRGEDKVVFLDTASHRVVGELTEGIGDGPFSLVVAPGGHLAFVNNTASHDVSVIALGEEPGDHRVIARLPVGAIPIVMAVHPSGETLWVGCEGSHELWVLEIPEALREADAGEPAESPAGPTEVAVLGMIHGGHRESESWGLEQVRETLRRLKPDVVCAEIPPDRWQRIWTDWTERGAVEDERVLRFPETVDVLLPLAVEMGFEIEPCATWTREMAALRRARLQQLETDPEKAALHAEYEKRTEEVRQRHAADPISEDDPRVIHSALYDRRVREELAPYDELLDGWIGPGGWTSINQAHYRLIEEVLERHRGRRVVITFGAGHKYWFLERLREREDVKLLEVVRYLPE